jgi:tetratricopeptide (TPR) repeat protein
MGSARISIPVLLAAILAAAVAAIPAQAQLEPAHQADAAPPTRPLTPVERGDLFMARKMYREAIDAYEQGGKNSVLLDKIGIAWHQLGQLEAARKSYEAAIKLDPKYADAINNVGTIYYAEKKYRSAISRYRRALKISPTSAPFWSNLGTAYYARGRFKEMSEAYARALELDPDVFEAHSAVGTQMLDRSVEDKARYHYEMARVYAHAGNDEMALQYLRRCLEEGFRDREKIDKAPEFATLRDTKEFKDLLTLEPRVL